MEKKRRNNEPGPLFIVGLVFLLFGGSAVLVATLAFLHVEGYSQYADPDVRLLPFIFMGLGIVFLIVGILCFAIRHRRRSRNEQLVKNGFYVTARIRDIHPNENVRINGRSPFVLECHYKDPTTGKTHIFKSENLMFYPIDAKDTDIRVYIDPQNMDHYYVDTSSLTDDIIIH